MVGMTTTIESDYDDHSSQSEITPLLGYAQCHKADVHMDEIGGEDDLHDPLQARY
jgi:hypothetical protein